MNDHYQIQELAADFWHKAGDQPSYPCNLRVAVTWALALDIEVIAGLSLEHVNAWTRQQGLNYAFSGHNRRLRGCLIAYRDAGQILIDASDPEDEQRFTLAHEIAHFILDYNEPRQQALNVMGDWIRPVLDGEREPNVEERLHAVLANTPLKVFSHLMERIANRLPTASVIAIEQRADRLAYELLAPAELVVSELQQMTQQRLARQNLDRLIQHLQQGYGLPLDGARVYAEFLGQHYGRNSFYEWLFRDG